MALPTNDMMKRVYHVSGDPEAGILTYAVDAFEAVKKFPKVWSFQPWPEAAKTVKTTAEYDVDPEPEPEPEPRRPPSAARLAGLAKARAARRVAGKRTKLTPTERAEQAARVAAKRLAMLSETSPTESASPPEG